MKYFPTPKILFCHYTTRPYLELGPLKVKDRPETRAQTVLLQDFVTLLVKERTFGVKEGDPLPFLLLTKATSSNYIL